MKKIVIAVLGLILSSNIALAQEEKTDAEYRPKQGNFTVSLLLGNGNFIESGSALYIGTDQVNGYAPYNTALDNSSNNLTNMIGVEGKYFVSDKFVVTFTGGVSMRHTPSYINIPEVRDSNTGNILVPGYDAVIGEDDIDIHVAPGVQFYFDLKKSKRLFPYLGVSLPIDYSRSTVFDPTVSTDIDDLSFGSSHVELLGIGLQGIAGLDYFLTEDLFIGFDVKPLTFSYITNTKKVSAGTLGRQADNYSFSFFSSYVFKLGFKL